MSFVQLKIYYVRKVIAFFSREKEDRFVHVWNILIRIPEKKSLEKWSPEKKSSKNGPLKKIPGKTVPA